MKYSKLIILSYILTSCSHTPYNEGAIREIAQEENCKELLQKVYDRDVGNLELNIALEERKLLSFKDKMFIIKQPSIEWYLNAKKGLTTLIKSWNKNRYPLFYLDSSDEIVPLAKSYADLLTEEMAGPLSEESRKKMDIINDWIESYKAYQSQLDHLLEERISYQYNIKVLKQLRIKKDEAVDIKLNFKIDGKNVTQVVTVRKEDRNLSFLISELEKKIAEFDGSSTQFGKIQERVIKQAIAGDVLTILQRELEFSVKNSNQNAEELAKKLIELNAILKDETLNASTYGVHKVVNHVFRKEVSELLHINSPFKKIRDMNHFMIRNQIEKVFGKKVKDGEALVQEVKKAEKDAVKLVSKAELNKDGPLKKLYSKIGTFTPYQKFMVSTKLSVIGYGAYRYFIVKKGSTVEVTGVDGSAVPVEGSPSTEVDTTTATEIKDHETAIEITNKNEVEKSNAESHVIEVHLENLFKKPKL